MGALPHHFGGYRREPAALTVNQKTLSTARIKQPGSGMLAARPMELPSPYAYTHERIDGAIVLVKTPAKPEESSFGVTLKMDMQSALVSQEWLLANGDTLNRAPPSKQDSSGVEPAKPLESNEPVITERDPSTTVSSPTSATGGVVDSTKDGEARIEVDHSVSTISNREAESTNQTEPKSRAPRRKRWFFSTLMVQDASKQNDRRPDDAAKRLRPGDIVLEIDGRSTAGLTFQQAVGLMKEASRTDGDGVVRCSIIIARRRAPIVKNRPSVSVSVSRPVPANPMTRKGPLAIDELAAFVNCMIKSFTDPMRTLGKPFTDDHFQVLAQMNQVLSSLSVAYMKGIWKEITVEVESETKGNALAYWTSEWQKEPQESKVPGVDFISDAQRASLRALPRPAKGCRCGAPDHEYVNDIKCPLYSNLRHGSASTSDLSNTDGILSSASPKVTSDLNAVEKAFKDRFVKLRTEQRAQEAEAKFVAQMEDLQLAQRNQAVFAPSLESMVLSAVAELQHGIRDLSLDPLPPPQSEDLKASTESLEKPALANDDDDSDDDDDVPLAQLGKRPSKTEVTPLKKPRREVPIRLVFLAKLLNAISSKWGHVYCEPSDEEHAW
jgi:hypothetical protein